MRRLRRHRDAAFAHGRVAGFTLMEVLLTSVLAAALLAGLWGLFGTYLKLFESGQAKVERAQLIRALNRQLSDDIHGVVAPKRLLENPNSGSSIVASAAASFGDAGSVATANIAVQVAAPAASMEERDDVPRFALVGNQHMLRLDVLQSPSPFDLSVPDDANLLNGPKKVEPKATGLRTILYSFEPPREMTGSEREPAPGLVRREKSWEQMQADAGAAGTRGSSTQSAEEAELSHGFAELSETDVREQSQLDDSVIWTPEIVALRFRYFDGHEWSNEWDSRKRNALPVAVQIAMRLEPVNDSKHASREIAKQAEESSERSGESADLSNDEDNGEISDELLDSSKSAGRPTEDEKNQEPIIRQLVLLQGSSETGEADRKPANSRLSFTNAEKVTP